jgi:5-(carboxyamino)imidazole ribonucleotide mutase
MIIIIIGSKADLDWANKIIQHIGFFGIEYKLQAASAHKTPEYLLKLLRKYETEENPIVYICVAGRSNALGGFVDANSLNCVINCPPYSEKYAGLDVLSSLRMPSGVAPITVLEPDQAAIAAAKILSVKDFKLRAKIKNFQIQLKEKLEKDDSDLSSG